MTFKVFNGPSEEWKWLRELTPDESRAVPLLNEQDFLAVKERGWLNVDGDVRQRGIDLFREKFRREPLVRAPAE